METPSFQFGVSARRSKGAHESFLGVNRVNLPHSRCKVLTGSLLVRGLPRVLVNVSAAAALPRTPFYKAVETPADAAELYELDT
jgi:hypothetical protein